MFRKPDKHFGRWWRPLSMPSSMYKKLLIILGILAIGTIAIAAPIYRVERSILPEVDSTYFLGTTTPSTNAWKGIISDNSTTTNATTTSLGVLNLTAASCDVKSTTDGVIYCGTDATGGGGGGSNSKWATSTPVLGIFPNAATYVGIGTTTPRFNLQLASSTSQQLVLTDDINNGWAFRNSGGLFYLATTSPTTFATSSASALKLDTNGDMTLHGLTLSSPLLAASGGTGAVTLTDGGVLVGSGTGAITALSVGTNGQLLVGSTSADPAFATLNCAGNLTCATGAGTLQIDVDDSFLLNTGDIGTGIYDFGGATTFEIPNAAGNTLGAIGQVDFDTTDMQFLIATTTANTPVVYPSTMNIWSATVASTSAAFNNGGTIPLPIKRDGFIIKEIHCWVSGGTSVAINLADSDGANNTDAVTCATTATSDTAMSVNYAVTASQLKVLEIGSIVGSPNFLSFTVTGVYTRE